MKINLISDLHCCYDKNNDIINWNRSTYKDKDGVVVSEQQQMDIALDNCKKYLNGYINTFEELSEKFKKRKKIVISSDYPIKDIKTYTKAKQYILELIDFVNDINYDKIEHYYDICDALDNYTYQACDIFIYDCSKIKLHFDRMLSEFKPEKLKTADYLVIAGDLGTDNNYERVYKELKEKTKDQFQDVFFVKGNHDYWWRPKNFFDMDMPSNMNLDYRYLKKEIGEYLILGCTLWSPVDEKHKYDVYAMNDYNYIPTFSFNRVNQLYQEESSWLRSNVQANPNKKIIIVTHNLPRKELVDGEYSKSRLNQAYAVMDGSCDDIKPLVWCHGHSHKYVDCYIDDVRYIRNPIGYREPYGYYKSEVEPKHWYDTIIEV